MFHMVMYVRRTLIVSRSPSITKAAYSTGPAAPPAGAVISIVWSFSGMHIQHLINEAEVLLQTLIQEFHKAVNNILVLGRTPLI